MNEFLLIGLACGLYLAYYFAKQLKGKHYTDSYPFVVPDGVSREDAHLMWIESLPLKYKKIEIAKLQRAMKKAK
ncbi:hypothetical protein HC723_14975 [Vibrio sp. S11_S32]|uniref:hypothetical protein n=1 Tax=Vibrio sp. S11_S32 TaxID=2720225 RepID=UPI0016809522|nr:hypothetical protein [Vibrio sp. S11_S32]MBD1577708.1 hypothetical protein [Vibrio sp. S11_S32]